MNIDERENAAALGLCLEGDALELYDALNRDENLDYDEIKERLVTYFDDEKINLVIRSKIAKRKLNPSENVSDYFQEIRRDAIKIGMSDEELLHSFIEGLPEAMAEHVVCKAPQTPTEAFTCAKTLQQIKAIYKPKGSLEEIKMAKVEALNSSPETNWEFKELKNEMESLKSEMRSFFRNNDNQINARYQQQIGPRDGYQYNRNNKNRFNNNSNFRGGFGSGNSFNQQNWHNGRRNNQPQGYQNNWQSRPNQNNSYSRPYNNYNNNHSGSQYNNNYNNNNSYQNWNRNNNDNYQNNNNHNHNNNNNSNNNYNNNNDNINNNNNIGRADGHR